MRKLLSALVSTSLLIGVSGCSSSKIQISVDKKYFEADESSAAQEIEKHISSEFKPKVGKGDHVAISIESIDEKDGFGAVSFLTNIVGKVETICVIAVLNTRENRADNAKKYIVTLGSQVLSAVDVEEPERIMEACYADMAENYYTVGSVDTDEITVHCGSVVVDEQTSFNVYIKPENATY